MKQDRRKLDEETAEMFVTYIEQNGRTMKEIKERHLTKADKIDLIDRMNFHFKWLVGIMLIAIFVATILGKLF